MLSILIVEDDRQKLQKIANCITSDPQAQVSINDIDTCSDGNTAKRLLKGKTYELLIIDIAIPDRADSEVSEDGGIRLLQEIRIRTGYRVPDHIVGLTGYAELAVSAREQFGRGSWSVIYYDPTSEEWSGLLRDKVQHILRARECAANAETSYHCHLAVVCALDDPELVSLRKIDWNWKISALPLDHTAYYRGEFVKEGVSYTVYAAAAPRMGMPASATLAMKMISAFRPRYLAMCGIAAGIGNVHAGDIVGAETCWDYGSGKYTRQNGVGKFLAAPHQIQISPEIRTKLKLLAQNDALLAGIRSEWPGDKPSDALMMHVGPMASGAAVLADESKIAEITEQHRKVAAVEMEAYGVFVAAEECAQPRPTVFALKSVADHGTEAKADLYQRYAAYTSAQALRHFVIAYL